MVNTLDESATQVLHDAVSGRDGTPGVPGVVAIATNREGTIYAGAAGKRLLPSGDDMTTDTVFAIFSCTKAITGTALMQAVEDGLIKLDDPAKKYVPEIAELQVLDGFDGDRPRTRAPKSDITVRQLMLHTAGFGYDFFSEGILKYNAANDVPSIISATKKSLENVLLFDPGERWEYGTNIDWVGLIVEAVRGKRLGDVFAERIFGPLGIEDMAFTMTPAMRERLAKMHQREPNGSFTPLPDFELPQQPELHMGGHGLYGTLGEYTKFIRMYLNDGAGPNGRVLRPETIAEMERNGLGNLKVTMLPGVIPTLSNDAEFFPGMPKSWGLTFMINDVDAPTGRPAGALAWAGLANLFFWIDRKNGIGGMWGTQILPFADGVSVPGYYDFEKAVYDSIR